MIKLKPSYDQSLILDDWISCYWEAYWGVFELKRTLNKEDKLNKKETRSLITKHRIGHSVSNSLIKRAILNGEAFFSRSNGKGRVQEIGSEEAFCELSGLGVKIDKYIVDLPVIGAVICQRHDCVGGEVARIRRTIDRDYYLEFLCS